MRVELSVAEVKAIVHSLQGTDDEYGLYVGLPNISVLSDADCRKAVAEATAAGQRLLQRLEDRC